MGSSSRNREKRRYGSCSNPVYVIDGYGRIKHAYAVHSSSQLSNDKFGSSSIGPSAPTMQSEISTSSPSFHNPSRLYFFRSSGVKMLTRISPSVVHKS